MSLVTQAVVNDIVSEMNGQPLGAAGPWTIFNVANITSGQIYDKITEANQYLQSMVSLGGASVSGNSFAIEQIKRFEVNYGSARLAQDLVGIETTDGFNYNLGGLAVQRANPQLQGYKSFIDSHLEIAKRYLWAFHQWFWVFNPDWPQGWSERGTPVGYWSVSMPRYG